jgi:type I restriction enzyme M protein
MTLSPRNANTMWMLHFLSHLNDRGSAGFVMAAGELSSMELARLEVRKSLVESDLIDCIVTLSAKLFANTPIPCSLWFISRNRGGSRERRRSGEILFIDARHLGTLIPGSRKQKQLSAEDIKTIADVYKTYRTVQRPADSKGFSKVAAIEDVRADRYALNPGRYVDGAPVDDAEDTPFEDRLPALIAQLRKDLGESEAVRSRLLSALSTVEGQG